MMLDNRYLDSSTAKLFSQAMTHLSCSTQSSALLKAKLLRKFLQAMIIKLATESIYCSIDSPLLILFYLEL